MSHKFHLKRTSANGNPRSVMIGLIVSAVSILSGAGIAVYSWAPVAVGMGNNIVPFVFGSALIIAGALFCLMIKLIDRYIY